MAKLTKRANRTFDRIENGMVSLEIENQADDILDRIETSVRRQEMTEGFKAVGDAAKEAGKVLFEISLDSTDWPNIDIDLETQSPEAQIVEDLLEEFPETDLYDGCGDGMGLEIKPDDRKLRSLWRTYHKLKDERDDLIENGVTPETLEVPVKPSWPKPEHKTLEKLTYRPFVSPDLQRLRKELTK